MLKPTPKYCHRNIYLTTEKIHLGTEKVKWAQNYIFGLPNVWSPTKLRSLTQLQSRIPLRNTFVITYKITFVCVHFYYFWCPFI